MFYPQKSSKCKQIVLFLSLCVLLPLVSRADDSSLTADNTPVLLSQGYTRGTLPNGLRYSIKKNSHIKNRVSMFLAVNSGSIHEKEEQRGLAHFLEHMAFNGSEHFPGNSLIEFMRQNGMSFGSHINAYTGFDETVYRFSLPTKDSQVVDKGLLILYDWLNALSLKKNAVDDERGVILNEWRNGLGFRDRFQNAFLPILLKGSRYPKRLPIGLKSIIEKASAEELKAFYEKWYNPQNALVVIVGDIDPKTIEQKIFTLFSPIKKHGSVNASGSKKIWSKVQLTTNNTPANVQVLQVNDKEAPQNSVNINLTIPRLPYSDTLGNLKKKLIAYLFNLSVNQRFSAIAQKNNAVLASLRLASSPIANISYFTFEATASKNALRPAYQLLLQAMVQLKRSGITQSELGLAKQMLITAINSAYNNRDKKSNASFAREEVDSFLGKRYNADIGFIKRHLKPLLASISLKNVNDFYRTLSASKDISLVSIKRPQTPFLSRTKFKSDYLHLNQVKVTLANPEEKAIPKTLIKNIPPTGIIKDAIYLVNSGFFKWTLSNGIVVYFKPTKFKNKTLIYRAFRNGGTATLKNSFGTGAVVSSLLNSVVNSSGVGGLGYLQYERYMAPKTFNTQWHFDMNAVRLMGSTERDTITDLFQHIYLSFTAPQFSQTLIDNTLNNLRLNYDDTAHSPEALFEHNVNLKLFQKDSRFLFSKRNDIPQSYDATTLKTAFTTLLPSARNFTFVFVGDVDKYLLRKHVNRYLASLPVNKPAPEQRYKKNLYRNGGVERYFIAPKGKAQSAIFWDHYLKEAKFSLDKKFRTILIANLMQSYLNIQLTNTLREKMSKTYSPRAKVAFDSLAANRITTAIYYSSAPKDTEALNQAVDSILVEIKKNRIDQTTFSQIKKQFLANYETQKQKNSFWLYIIQPSWLSNDDNTDSIFKDDYIKQILASIKGEDLARFARENTDPKRKIRFVMKPKKS